jgi:anti-anti-sigma regulatory factor/anti-sigma regulatory factor (Ser/Thr protein kinase)
MTRLQTHIEAERPVTVVRFGGPFDLADASTVWNLLVKLLADQPDALVIDLSSVAVDDPQVLLVFGALARRAGIWPGVPVIVVAPDADLRTALHRQAVDRRLAVCAQRGEALVLAHGAPVPARLRESLLPDPGAARHARDLATEACLRWELPHLVTPASIITSELVTNGVRHAGTPLELALARTARYLHLAVRDGDPRPAVRREPGQFAVAGRGLLIVERTALSWGSTRVQSGKVVWATLAADARLAG